MSEKVLQTKNLTISFRTSGGKVHAVRDISFDLIRGETLAIVGESGSGKSVTSKAILGISAANAIMESGEILYGDKDLLQIDEEDFHKIRGDKIAMVFQDPLSALNPIMRTGKQLTEAMLLNNKADRKDARKKLRKLRANLHKQMQLAHGTSGDAKEKERVRALSKRFSVVQDKQIRLEGAYNNAMEHLREAIRISQSLKADLDKHVHQRLKNNLNRLRTALRGAQNENLLKAEDAKTMLGYLDEFAREKHHARLAERLGEMSEKLQRLSSAKKPNFFSVAYALDPTDEGRPTEESFLKEYLSCVERALAYSAEKSAASKKHALEVLKTQKPIISQRPLKRGPAKKALKAMSAAVEGAIDPLESVTDSQMHTFRRGVRSILNRYRDSISKNRREARRYRRAKRKHDRITAKGKDPGWKVVPLDLTDLNHVQDSLINMVEAMQKRLEAAEKNTDIKERALNLVRYRNRLASRVVDKVTKAAAKEKAINLMREVGLPEPELRYKQYPFELSGGMRQRIVIAIALSANPDILICDEPTTALDVTIQSQILELINRLKKERDLSIIFITHDLGVVANMADRIAVMYAGKIVELGTADEVFYEPAHPYTWALLSSMPDLETKEKLEAIPGTPPNMLMPPKGDAFAARNHYAMKIDFEKQPPMFKITDTHYAATWLLHPHAPKVEPPAIVTERIRRMKAWEAKNHE